MTTILHIDASMRTDGSTSRDLSLQLVGALQPENVIRRDLVSDPVPLIDATWIDANFTPAADRSDAQKARLTLSDSLVAEIANSDLLVIGVPIYNFGVPAAMKAWADQVCRAGLSFRYTANGPEGLLTGKRAILVVASGGTEVDSAIDYATPYLRQILGFLGITDVDVIAADQLMADPSRLDKARQQMSELLAA